MTGICRHVKEERAGVKLGRGRKGNVGAVTPEEENSDSAKMSRRPWDPAGLGEPAQHSGL